MSKNQILETVKMFAKSNGRYGRLLMEIDNNPEILDILEKENFSDPLDLIFFLEG